MMNILLAAGAALMTSCGFAAEKQDVELIRAATRSAGGAVSVTSPVLPNNS